MKRDELLELHYITHMGNVPSILRYGILSHNRANGMQHLSIGMQEVQDRRARVKVPGGLLLHDYVNLYICARNPMLYKLRAQHRDLCVLRVSTDILDAPKVVITSQNASSDYARFAAAPDGLAIVDREVTFADDWTADDQYEFWRRKSAKCAEVLVPHLVDSSFIIGAYVSCQEAQQRLQDIGIRLTINGHMFFREDCERW